MKLPRLLHRKGRLYWQDSAQAADGKRPLVPLGKEGDPRAMAEYHRIELGRSTTDGSLGTLLQEFNLAFLGDKPGEQYTRRPKQLAARTRKEYRRQIPKLSLAFGHMRPESVTTRHIQTYLERHPAPIAANREIALLSRIYTWATRLGKANQNPCLLAERNEEQPRDRIITEAEYLARKAVAPPVMADVMDLTYLTGLRISDLLRIHLSPPASSDDSQVWLDGDWLYVRAKKSRRRRPALNYHALVDQNGTTLLGQVIERVRARTANRTVQGLYLITTRNGRAYSLDGIKSLWWKMCLADGIEDFHLNDIRAMSATDAEQQGLDPQVLLGHGSRKTTEIYLRSRRKVKVDGPQSNIVRMKK